MFFLTISSSHQLRYQSSMKVDLVVHCPCMLEQAKPFNSYTHWQLCCLWALWQSGSSTSSEVSCFGFARSMQFCEQSTGLCSGGKWTEDLPLQRSHACVRMMMVSSWSCPESLEFAFLFQTVTCIQTVWFIECSLGIVCLQVFALAEIVSARIKINRLVFAPWNTKYIFMAL